MPGIFLDDISREKVMIKFHEIDSVNEFTSLLNFIERNNTNLKDKSKFKAINSKFLYHLSITKDDRYKEFSISKKSGKKRKIETPDELLKRVQRLINYLLQVIFEPYSHYSSNGFLFGKGIIRNAKPHINKNNVLNLDIKDFFPSINFRRIKVVLELNPFNLKNERERISFLIANLCTYKNHLPQGAPTSPILSNIVTQRLDRKLTKESLELNIKYTRYADDLTFSSNQNILNKGFVKKVKQIVECENFKLNKSKTRLQKSTQRQQVTGLIVNEKLNVKREYLQKVRAMLNNWDKGGINYAEEVFKSHQTIEKIDYPFKNVLLGHISFIRQIKGDENNISIRLIEKFTLLNNLIDYSFIKNTAVKQRLIEDNHKMEQILLLKNQPEDDKFISFCTSAFHQIENLLNYYYWSKFSHFEQLLEYLLLNNPSFKKRYKTLENAKNNFKKISQLNINLLVYLYEKEFFFDKKIFYKQEITKLREIRNDDSHRCSVINVDKDEINIEYAKLEEKKIDFKKRGKKLEFSKKEKNFILKYETFTFLENKNYKEVRKVLTDMTKNIEKYFA
nr:reverse transcriptase family protein [uncultured Psychroserpens sp.]